MIQKHYDTAPNSYLKEFAGISYLTKEFGDRKDKDGSSLFLKNVDNITQEMQIEILKRDKLNYVFQSLSIISILPVLLLEPLKNWCLSNFSFTGEFYNGKMGLLAQIIIVVITIVSYILTRKLKDSGGVQTEVSHTDHPWQEKLYNIPLVKKIVNMFIPKKGTKDYKKMQQLLKDSASKSKMEWIYVNRIILAVISFVATIILTTQLHKIAINYVYTEPTTRTTVLGTLSDKEKKKAEKSLLTQATAAASALKNTKEVISLFPTTKTAADQNDDIDNIISNKISATGEDQFVTAQEVVKPAENAACYYTLTSVKSGVPNGELRTSIVQFASQFIGNPYVWGGTSLTNGADCSGFVQSIYAQYGYTLPRVAEDQAQYGTKIPVEEAQPGDLIFYARNGYIYHVVMYAGNGETVEAQSSRTGIVHGTVNTNNAVWAVRILEDTPSTVSGIYGSDISEVNATLLQYGQSLGTFKITHYCGGSCCNDEWAGVTATGAPLVEGDTIAVDPTVIPYGTKVIINGHIFTATDCGGAIKGNRIDVFVNDHNRANQLGVYYTDVYVLK